MMKNLYFGLNILLAFSASCYSRTFFNLKSIEGRDPDWDRDAGQLIISKGYPCEEHKVITDDGYILGVFRIPHGRNSQTIGRPVLLQHGLLDSAATWVANFPDQSLSFMLADAGYDVWLGNMRGNRYSRAHVKYNPDKDDAFWDFSWDDMARDDLPSMIKYILQQTKQFKIAYVGHSQGTMIGFAQFGNPNSAIAQNVSFWTALAPVAHLGHIISPLRLLSEPFAVKEIEKYWHIIFGRNEYLPSTELTRWLSATVCEPLIIDRTLCENVLFLLMGPDKKNLNETRVPVYAAHVPAGTSVKNMVHFAQGVQTNVFEAYDYGSPANNQQHYNQTTPPIYPIETISIPTAIFSGGSDWLADPTDAQFILDNVGHLVYQKFIKDYNHMDFMIALNANQLIYNDVISLMNEYHPLH